MRRISGSSTARLARNRAERGEPTGCIRKERSRSWSRTLSNPARERTAFQASSSFRRWRLPGFLPRMTQGLPGRRERPARRLTAGGESETTRAPVFVSGSLSSASPSTTSSQRSVSISDLRYPASTKILMAATTTINIILLAFRLEMSRRR